MQNASSCWEALGLNVKFTEFELNFSRKLFNFVVVEYVEASFKSNIETLGKC